MKQQIRCFGYVNTHKKPSSVAWKPPVGAAIKLNVDGRSLGNPGRSGFRGIIKIEHVEKICVRLSLKETFSNEVF